MIYLLQLQCPAAFIQVLQERFSPEQIAKYVPAYSVSRAIKKGPGAFRPEFLSSYECVASVDVATVIGAVEEIAESDGKESLLVTYHIPARTMGVGDILVNEAGDCFFVDIGRVVAVPGEWHPNE